MGEGVVGEGVMGIHGMKQFLELESRQAELFKVWMN